MVILSSCASIKNNPDVLNARIRHSKTLRETRRDLRINYHYHQTKLGRFLNFEI